MRKLYLNLALSALALLCFAVDSSGQTLIQLGSGTATTTTTTTSPVNIFYRNSIQQFVYTASEINAAGVNGSADLEAIGFYVVQSPIYDMPGYTIKMKHVTQTNVAAALGTGGWTTVKNPFTYSPVAGGFDMIQLDVPFQWNGTDNIGIEICHQLVNPSWNSSGTARYYSTSSGFRYSRSDVTSLCGSTPNSQNTYKPQAQLEFTAGLPNDAGIAAIAKPAAPSCTFGDSVFVELKNFGTNPLSQVDIEWEVNGVMQPTFAWTGNVAPGQSENLLNLGNGFTFQEGDIIRAWTTGSINNGTPDDSLLNDTAAMTLKSGLSGTYTIDLAGGGDYTDFTSALNDVMTYGACGHVIFESQGGAWNEMLEISTAPFMSDSSTVTFRSASGNPATDTLYVMGGANGQVLDFNDADWFRFENLTLMNASSDPRVITMENGSDNNIISGCHIIGSQQNSTSTNDAVVYSGGGNDNYNQFLNNYVYGGSYGFYWQGVGTTSLEEGTIIQGNEIIDAYYSSIRLYYEDSPQVRNNYIASDVAYTAGRGIWAYYCDNAAIFDGNHIDADSTAWPQYGMYLGYLDGSALKQGVVSNNKIHLGAGVSTDDHWGIYTIQGGFTNLWNNTLVINTTNTNARGYYCNNSATNSFVNNIVEMMNEGTAMEFLGSGAINTGDYNNVRSNAAIFAELDNTTYANLADWVLGTGYDQMTQEVDPMFNDLFELRPCNDSLDGYGMSSSLVPTDFDGQMRGSSADIGADEYTALSNWDIGADTGLCSGATLSLAALYADTAIWSNPSTVLDTNNTYTVQSPNTYYVEAITSCGTVTDSIVVNAPHSLSMANNDNICPGDVTMLSAGTADGTFMWSNGEITSEIEVDAPGVYVLEMTDAWGCMMSDTTTVTESPEVDLEDSLSICDGGVEFLDASIPGTYNWSTGSTAQTVSISNSGSYSVTVTDQFGCVSEDSTFVTVTQIPSASFTDSISFLTVAFTSTVSDYDNLVWDFGDGTFSSDENPIHVFPWPGGTFTVTLTINNACGTFTTEGEVTVDLTNSTGLAEITGVDAGLAVYPNPSNGEFVVGYNAAENGELLIEVMNIQGQVVLEQANHAINGLNQYNINLENISSGIYMVKTTMNDQVTIKKITIH